jgi:hypothetical protein
MPLADWLMILSIPFAGIAFVYCTAVYFGFRCGAERPFFTAYLVVREMAGIPVKVAARCSCCRLDGCEHESSKQVAARRLFWITGQDRYEFRDARVLWYR